MSDPYAAISAPVAQKRGWMQDVAGFMANVNRGLGIGDEMAAGAHTGINVITGKTPITDIPADFNRSMATQRQTEDSYAQAHPHVAALARGTGNALAVAAPVGPGAEAFATGGRTINALRAATTAGLGAAGYAAVDRGTPAQRARAAADAANPIKDPIPFVLGAGVGAATGGGAKSVPTPTIDQLTAAKTAAYKRVDDSGFQVPPEDFQALTTDMAARMDKEGFNAGNHPKAAAMITRIGDSDRGAGGASPTLTQLDQLRQQIGRDVASSSEPGERRMGTIMRGAIDDYIAKLPESADLLQARDLNTRIAKLSALDNLDEAASDRAAVTGSGGNGQNALRQNVVRFKNQVGNLTPDELAATQTAIDGTGPQNALRLIGKLSPEGNGLAALAHTTALVGELGTGHSPVAMTQAATALGGAVAKRASDAIAEGNVQALRDLIAQGGDAAQAVSAKLADPANAELRGQLANDLAAQSGAQSQALQSQNENQVPPPFVTPEDPYAAFATATSPR